MYRNIRYAFFQPAENDMITLVHFHLHNPIMIGNKKTKDVQFYAEVGVCLGGGEVCGGGVWGGGRGGRQAGAEEVFNVGGGGWGG